MLLIPGVDKDKYERRLNKAKPGDLVTLVKPGSVKEAWNTGVVQHPQTIYYIEPSESVPFDIDSTSVQEMHTPISSELIQEYVMLTKKLAHFSLNGKIYSVRKPDGQRAVLEVIYTEGGKVQYTSLQTQGAIEGPHSDIFTEITIMNETDQKLFWQEGITTSPAIGRNPQNMPTEGQIPITDDQAVADFQLHLDMLRQVNEAGKRKRKLPR